MYGEDRKRMKSVAFDRDPWAALWGRLPEHMRRSIPEFVLRKIMRISLLLAGLLCTTLNAVAQTLAFPAAEGWGRFVAGGWPLLQSAPAPADTDGDGMPDAWEKEDGLDPKDPADRNGHHVNASYSNLES
jgi:hypothetical protein